MVFDKAAYYREYWRKNREKLNAYQSQKHREQYSKNFIPFLLSSKKWRENNPEKLRECQKKNHQNHPETLKKAQKKFREKYPKAQQIANKKWRKKYPECSRKASRKWKRENPEKLRAEKMAQKHIQLSESCEFCPAKENLERHHPDYNYPLITVTTCRECHRWIENKITITLEEKL